MRRVAKGGQQFCSGETANFEAMAAISQQKLSVEAAVEL